MITIIIRAEHKGEVYGDVVHLESLSINDPYVTTYLRHAAKGMVRDLRDKVKAGELIAEVERKSALGEIP
jgi:hypothetical protein